MHNTSELIFKRDIGGDMIVDWSAGSENRDVGLFTPPIDHGHFATRVHVVKLKPGDTACRPRLLV